MNLYKSIADWIATYEPITDWIYFNVTNFEAGNIAINSVAMNRYLRKFVDGSKEVELVIAVDMIKEHDTGTSDNNLDAIQEVNNFADWIDKNDTKPDFDDNQELEKIEVLENAPTLSVDSDAGLARYQFQVKFTYREREE